MKGYKCDGYGEFLKPDEVFRLELTVNTDNAFADIYQFDLCESCYLEFIAEPYINKKDR